MTRSRGWLRGECGLDFGGFCSCVSVDARWRCNLKKHTCCVCERGEIYICAATGLVYKTVLWRCTRPLGVEPWRKPRKALRGGSILRCRTIRRSTSVSIRSGSRMHPWRAWFWSALPLSSPCKWSNLPIISHCLGLHIDVRNGTRILQSLKTWNSGTGSRWSRFTAAWFCVALPHLYFRRPSKLSHFHLFFQYSPMLIMRHATSDHFRRIPWLAPNYNEYKEVTYAYCSPDIVGLLTWVYMPDQDVHLKLQIIVFLLHYGSRDILAWPVKKPRWHT